MSVLKNLEREAKKGIKKARTLGTKAINASARATVDISTLGNKKLVDQYSGGLASSYQGALQGNSKDIVRIGATAGATAYGGPTAGIAVNQGFANGGNIFKAAGNFLSQNGMPQAANIVSSFGESRSQVSTVTDSGYFSTQSGYDSGMNSKKLSPWVIIGGVGILAAILIIKRK